MPSSRIIITSIAAVAAIAAYFMVRSSYPADSKIPMAISMGVLIGAYIIVSLVYGVVQGMREAQAPKSGPQNRAGNDRRSGDRP